MSRIEEEEHSHHHRRHRRRRHREKKKKSGSCSKKESSLKKKKNFADVSSSSTTSVPNDNPFSTEFELTNTNSTLDAFSIYGNTSSNDTAESGSKRKMAAPSTSHYETEASKRNDYIQDDKSAALKGHICCVHGNLKCQKGLKEKSKKKKKKRGKKEEDDDMTGEKTGPYETANKYLKMKTISASDIASPNQSVQRVSSKHHHRHHRRHHHRSRSRISEICSSPATSSTTTKSQAELSNGYVRVSKEHPAITPPKSPVTAVLRYENYDPKNQEFDKLKDDDNNNDYVLFKKFLTKQSSNNVGGKKDGYEVTDDDEDDYKSKSRSLRKPLVEKKESASDNTFERVFLGEMTSKEAERKSLNCSSFRLYYRLPSITPDSYDRLPPKLSLYIVYRNSRGNFYHFPIIARKIHSYNGPQITQLTVEYGEIAPNFDSLSALIKYYETYCIIYGKHLEIFPWWHSDSNVKEKNHHKSSRKKYPRHCNHF